MGPINIIHNTRKNRMKLIEIATFPPLKFNGSGRLRTPEDGPLAPLYPEQEEEFQQQLKAAQQAAALELRKKHPLPDDRKYKGRVDVDAIAPHGWNARTGKEFTSAKERAEFFAMIDLDDPRLSR